MNVTITKADEDEEETNEKSDNITRSPSNVIAAIAPSPKRTVSTVGTGALRVLDEVTA